MALAEMLEVFPIFVRRVKLVQCIPWVILGTALGKTAGCIIILFPALGKMTEVKTSMDQNAKKQREQKEYQEYVKAVTPVHNLWMNMTKAFVTGGVICMIGQGILNYCKAAGLDKEISASWCAVILVILFGTSDRIEYLSTDCQMGRRRSIGTDYRLCQFSSGSGN